MDFLHFDEYVSSTVSIINSSIFHTVLELFLAAVVVWIIMKKSDKKVPLSFEEEEKKIRDYNPEPLVGEVDPNHPRLSLRIVEGKAGRNITVDGLKCLNFGTHNYLGLHGKESIEEEAIKSVRKYGVGSCGPRGFYGTVDVHLVLEQRLAKFFGLEDAIVYSYGFSAIASAIPAYSKRRDIIFVDQNVNFAIQKGLDASRSEIKYFNHNDTAHLEKLLDEQAQLDAKNRKKAQKTRKFLIVEGIYMNTGNMCPLPKLIELKNKHKLRIFIDESISFGTLGKTGRGVTEHFCISVDEIDLIMGSLEWGIGAIGGFCVGSSFIVEHQRLSGLGYCFSASLPPLLTTAAISSLDVIEHSPHIVTDLQHLSAHCHQSLLENVPLMSQFNLLGDPLSPVKHLVPSSACDILTVVNNCLENSIAVAQSSYLDEDKQTNPPSIIVIMNTLHTKEDISILISTLQNAIDHL